MLRSVLLLPVALAGIALFVAPNANWSPAPEAMAESVVPAVEAAPEPELLPSYVIPVRRVAFPQAPAKPILLAELTVPETAASADPNADVRYVIAGALNLRDAPTTSSQVIGSLPSGSPVTVIGQERSWLEVVAENGETGWVSGKFVSEDMPS